MKCVHGIRFKTSFTTTYIATLSLLRYCWEEALNVVHLMFRRFWPTERLAFYDFIDVTRTKNLCKGIYAPESSFVYGFHFALRFILISRLCVAMVKNHHNKQALKSWFYCHCLYLTLAAKLINRTTTQIKIAWETLYFKWQSIRLTNESY